MNRTMFLEILEIAYHRDFRMTTAGGWRGRWMFRSGSHFLRTGAVSRHGVPICFGPDSVRAGVARRRGPRGRRTRQATLAIHQAQQLRYGFLQ